jgi:ribose transport system permease protein
MKIKSNTLGNVGSFLIENNTYAIFVVLILICTIISPNFLSSANLINLCQQYAGIVILTLGELFVILTGGIDLSVGSIVSVGSVVMSLSLTVFKLGVVPSVIITIVFGILLGSISGILIAYGRMAPFIATLAVMTIASGLAMVISNGSPIITPANSLSTLGVGRLFPFLTWLSVVAIIVILIFWFVQKYTPFGRIVLGIGSNETAISLAGIRVRLHKVVVYAISGGCAGLSGIIACARTSVGSPLVGQGLELDCIAACVIGGASLMGGHGSVIKTVVGVFVLAFIGNIMNLLAVPSYPQDIIKGIIIIGAVLLQAATTKSEKSI